MFLETIFFLFGVGIWDSGLESVSVDPMDSDIAPIVKEWTFYPLIDAKAVVIMEKESAQVVYAQNAHARLPMASLTKMMTAIIILENHNMQEVVEVSRGSHYTDGASMKLEIGERISVQNLLAGLLIRSGNDAAVALSRYHARTVYDFVDVMNERVKSLYLADTNFQNPHGFDADRHYSSAYDLALIAKKLLNFPLARNIVQTKEVTVYSTNGVIPHTLKNTNKLLGTVFPVSGIKTGTTDKAGQCLTLLVKGRSGREYIVVILGSTDRYLDAKTLIWRIMLD
jgi:D-alanyl-D-alanine carboxypeptidase